LADLAQRVTPLEERMRAVASDVGIATTVTNAIDAFAGDGADGPAGQLVAQITGANAADATVAYMTEAPFFQAAGISSIVCGPGDIAQAHAPDEFIEVAELRRCLSALERLADSLTR
ncbi:MAG: M20/M25/M40 family metallo-hydrolase, partial [Pseudomonadota bacterium]